MFQVSSITEKGCNDIRLNGQGVKGHHDTWNLFSVTGCLSQRGDSFLTSFGANLDN